MKNISKKFIAILLCLALLFSLSISSMAAKEKNNKESIDTIKGLLNQWEKSIEEKDTETYLSVFDDEMRHSLKINLEKNKSLPFYSIDSLTIKNIKRLSQEDLIGIYPVYVNEDLQHEIYYFYYEAKVKDKMETKYSKNGENFILCVITKQNNEWKISQLSSAPEAALLLEKEINLGSNREAELLSKQRSAPEAALLK